MLQLTAAALFFVGIHLLISGTRLRDTLVARCGETVFRLGFSALSLAALLWLVHAYRQAPYLETWGQIGWFKPIAASLMLLAFILAVTGITTPNPTAVGGERWLDAVEVKGILRITRHPLLWGLSLWALVHVLANGDAAALILFGSLLVLCLAGTLSIDAKRRRALGEQWASFAARTSNVPLAAIFRQRPRLRWQTWATEIGWWRIGLAVAAYLATLHFHARLFGVSPLL